MISRLSRITLTFCAALFVSYSLAATKLDAVVAVVNDRIITQSQLNAAMTDIKMASQAAGKSLTPAEIKQKALDILIDQGLQLQLADRNKVVIKDTQIDEAVNNIAKQNHLTLDQLKEALVKQGTDYNRFREQIRTQMTIHQLQQRIFSGRATVSDQEIAAFMKNPPPTTDPNTLYKLDDLVIPVEENASSDAVKTANTTATALLAKAKQGVSFAQLAQSDSTLHYSDLGWRKQGDLPALFAEPVEKMKPGNAIGPIRAPNGLHLLKLLDVKGQAVVLTAAQAKNILFQKKIQGQIDSWLKELRKSSYVELK